MSRTRRNRWVIYWVFAVPLVLLAVVAIDGYPQAGIPVAILVAAGLAYDAVRIRREERRVAAGEPEGSPGELLTSFRAISREGGRLPDEHGPGDAEAVLVLDEVPGDDAGLPGGGARA